MNENKGPKSLFFVWELLPTADILKMCKHNSYESSQQYASKSNLICSLTSPIAEEKIQRFKFPVFH